MLSNAQKEHLTYTLVGQIFSIILMVVILYQYVFPGLSTINGLKSNAQTAISSYKDTFENGIKMDNLMTLLKLRPERAELAKIIESDTPGADRIIQKTPGSELDYLSWLKSEIGKTDEEKKELVKEKAKLNSIIPTMSPYSSNIEENNITLRQYVTFIEKKVLKEFNFDSNVVIGMQGVTFGRKGTDVPESIGMFDFRLDFKGTNEDIARFIDFLSTTGKPDILSNKDLLPKESVPDAMSNPLITVENFSIQERMDPDNPTKENSGRVTIRFYVRGVSKDDLSFLRENIKLRENDLKNRITASVMNCDKDGVICEGYRKKLFAFQKKYEEYNRSLQSAKMSVDGTDEIFALTQSTNTLRSLEQEFEVITQKNKTN